jgi:hypothetical protein
VLPEQLQRQSASAPAKLRLPAPRQLVWLQLPDPTSMTPGDIGLLLQIEQDRDVKQARDLASGLANSYANEHSPTSIPGWLKRSPLGV